MENADIAAMWYLFGVFISLVVVGIRHGKRPLTEMEWVEAVAFVLTCPISLPILLGYLVSKQREKWPWA